MDITKNPKRVTSKTPYDVTIIGGGIAGLYCAYKLSEYKKVLVFDERDYIGGRIYTHPMQYEVGAARFNNSHKLLLELIDDFRLTPIPISKEMDYIHCSKKQNQKLVNAHVELDTKLSYILNNTKNVSELRNITFYEHIVNTLKSKKQADELIHIFGYYSEIKKMNAFDAYNTFKNDFRDVQYYFLKEGLSYLCEKLKEKIEENGSRVYLNSYVNSVEKHDEMFVITRKNYKTSIQSKNVIFAIKPHQLKGFPILKPIHHLTKAVYNAPLIRIYAIYKNPIWFKNIKRTTTNNLLRQIIPINKERGLIMVSYTDGIDTRPFLNDKYTLKSNNELKKIVKENLKLVFPECNIPDPTYFKAHLWTVGCHHWLPNYNSDKIRKEICNPLKNVYICGEGFSNKQAWMEGSLTSCLNVIKSLST